MGSLHVFEDVGDDWGTGKIAAFGAIFAYRAGDHMAWLVKKEDLKFGEWYLHCLGWIMITSLFLGFPYREETGFSEFFAPWLDPNGIPNKLVAALLTSVVFYPGWIFWDLIDAHYARKRELQQQNGEQRKSRWYRLGQWIAAKFLGKRRKRY